VNEFEELQKELKAAIKRAHKYHTLKQNAVEESFRLTMEIVKLASSDISTSEDNDPPKDW